MSYTLRKQSNGCWLVKLDSDDKWVNLGACSDAEAVKRAQALHDRAKSKGLFQRILERIKLFRKQQS